MRSSIIICPGLPPAFAAPGSQRARAVRWGWGWPMSPLPSHSAPTPHVEHDGRTSAGVGGIPVNPQKVDITESQKGRGHLVQPPAQAGSPRAGCTAPRPGGAGISAEKETPQPPWAAWARAPSPSEGRSSSSSSAGTS